MSALSSEMVDNIVDLFRRGQIPSVIQYRGTWLTPMTARNVEKRIEQWQPLADDVILVGYMRCGTNWLHAIAYSLAFFDSQYDPLVAAPSAEEGSSTINVVLESVRAPSESDCGYDGTLRVERMTQRPRIYKTHLAYRALPESIRKHDKIVFIARNPKDMLCSITDFLVNCAKSSKTLDFPPESLASVPAERLLDALIGRMLDGHEERGPFVENVLDFWRASRRNPNAILFLHYEQLVHSGLATVRRLANFLGGRAATLTDCDLNIVLQRTNIDQLRATMTTSKTYRWHADISNSVFYHKGSVGQWKERLSKEQSEAIDEHVQAALANDDSIGFMYE